MNKDFAVVPIGQAIAPPEQWKHMRTTLDVTTPAGQRQLVRAKIGEDFLAEDVIDQPLAVVDILQHATPRTQKDTGEESVVIRTVLICDDGTRVSSVSPWVMDALEKIMQCGLVPSKDAPLNVKIVKRVASASKRAFHSLDLA